MPSVTAGRSTRRLRQDSFLLPVKQRLIPAAIAAAIIFGLLTLSSASLGFEPVAAPEPPATAAGKLDQRVDKLAAQLGLNDVQKGQLRELVIQRRAAVRRAVQTSGYRFRAQLKDVLTPDQRTKLAEIIAAKRAAGSESGCPALGKR